MLPTTVLIVDDDPEFLDLMAERMASRGLIVTTAQNGHQALNYLEGNKYDAIILDMMMPGLDGIETLKRVRQDHPDMQVILLTGYGSVETGVEAIREGALDYLEKPADMEELTQKITEAKTRRTLLVDKAREEAVREALKKYGW